MFKWFVAAVFLLQTTPDTAPTRPLLWDKAEAGMSSVEIRALYPSAQVGAAATLEIPDYVFTDDPFRVVFDFEGGGLKRVALVHQRPETVSRSSVGRFVDAVSKTLGPPDEHRSKTEVIDADIYAWRRGELRVLLWRVRLEGGRYMMSISFEHDP